MPEESYYDLLQVQPTADWEVIEFDANGTVKGWSNDAGVLKLK